MDQTHDMVVIGGGAGGLAAARAAHHEGAKVVLINDGPLGGDCTFTGCVPSKALIESGRRGASFAEAIDTVHSTIARIAATENADVLRSEGVDVIEGRATIEAPGVVKVDSTTLRTPATIVATGSRAFVPPIDGISDVSYLTNESMFEARATPGRLGILGGGPIGSEMAQAYRTLGIEVSLFERADQILGREEPDAAVVVAQALMESGVDLQLGASVESVADSSTGGVQVTTTAGVTTVDELLVAVGRTPNTSGFGLEEAGVELTARGHIATNDQLQTNVEGIYAVGDVNGKLPFTHAADEMGRLVAWTVMRRGRSYDFNPGWIPWVTFTDPELARVGVIESEAPRNARVVELPMAENDRAIVSGRTEGFIKIIVGPRRLIGNAGGGKILGATIVAPRAGEMIHEPALAMRTNMFAGRLAQSVHAYPSWSTGIQKAMGQLFYEIEGRQARPVRR